MTITILLSRRIIRSVPLLKGKKAEAPSLPDDPPIGLHTVSCNCPPLIDRPFVHLFEKKKKRRRASFIVVRKGLGKKFVAALLEFKPDTKPFEDEDRSTPVKNC